MYKSEKAMVKNMIDVAVAKAKDELRKELEAMLAKDAKPKVVEHKLVEPKKAK